MLSLSSSAHVRSTWWTRRPPWTLTTLIRCALGTCLWLFITSTWADPDLWGHLRFGLDMLKSGALPSHDTYSFTADRLWINHEWLSELLMAVAYARAGATGLIVLKLLSITTVAGIIIAIAKEEKSTRAARDTLVCLTILATYTRMAVIRPQMFSIAMFCSVLYLLRQIDRGRAGAVWGLPLCFAVWVNLHGGWIVGFAVVGVWFAARFAQQGRAGTGVRLLPAGLAIIVATLVNPYGVGLWRFLAETVRLHRADIAEWAPLFSLPPLILACEAVLPTIALISVATTRRRVPLRHVAMLAVVTVGALKVNRLDAFAQAAVAILLAPQILAGLQAFGAALRAPFWRAPLRAGAIAIVLGVVGVAGGASRLRAIVVQGSWIPDKEAALFLRDHAPGSRVLTWFDWGEYALYQLAPAGIRVSIDGRRETVYSDDVLEHHWAFYRADAEDLDYADRIGADYIWLPVNTPVVRVLPQHGWHTVFHSSRSVVFARVPAEISRAEFESRERKIFPWP
jgi:hypothetical protein